MRPPALARRRSSTARLGGRRWLAAAAGSARQAQRRRCRARQHVNPLALSRQQPPTVPLWEDVYADPTLPLHVDVGCSFGQFSEALALSRPDVNVLGLEIRDICAQGAISSGMHTQPNLHLIKCNAAVGLQPLLQGQLHPYPGPVEFVYILHPDPWFKRAHRKRRLVNPNFVDVLGHVVEPGGKLLLQTDVSDLMVDMQQHFTAGCKWWSRDSSGDSCCVSKLLGIPSPRESFVREKGGSIYASMFARTRTSVPNKLEIAGNDGSSPPSRSIETTRST